MDIDHVKDTICPLCGATYKVIFDIDKMTKTQSNSFCASCGVNLHTAWVFLKSNNKIFNKL